MRKFNVRNIGYLLSCLLISLSSAFAQYKVEGGAKVPFVVNDVANRIQVNLVYGIEGVTISYTSASTAHQWYRYKIKALEREKISSSQQGNTSVISNLEEGYGYGVVEGDHFATAEYIWLIDYSKYPVDIQNLQISAKIDPCTGFQLDGTDLTPKLSYQTPAGNTAPVVRQYEIAFYTQKWDESNKLFRKNILIVEVFNDSPISKSTKEIPLQDTKVELMGDLFARHFGIEQTFTIDHFEASKVVVYPYREVLSEGSGNISPATSDSEGRQKFLAPAKMRFTAYANEPVASLFSWKVTEKSNPGNSLVHPNTGPEFEYDFNRFGNFTISLEVSDRSGKCVNAEHTFDVNITETEMRVPNAFTPVGSPGTNDVFKVIHQSVISFKGWIFNRWGSELFYWNDPAKGWDGKYRGKYVPAGPYFYVIEYTGTDGKKNKKSGDVNVIHVKDNIIEE